MEKKTVTVPDMACQHCLMRIKREALALPGVKSVEGDPASKKVTIEYEAPAAWAGIAAALGAAGYPPQG